MATNVSRDFFMLPLPRPASIETASLVILVPLRTIWGLPVFSQFEEGGKIMLPMAAGLPPSSRELLDSLAHSVARFDEHI